MNIIGTMYLVDEPNIDVLKNALSTMPPPNTPGVPIKNTIMCLDLDEGDNMLELWFPDHCQKATILCPPPLALYKEIDGDMEGFINEYNYYLEMDSAVQEFIASILFYSHHGGSTIIYIPCHMEDDSLWVHTLTSFFLTHYGISIGGLKYQFSYDPTFDNTIAAFLYTMGWMDIYDYAISSPSQLIPSLYIKQKIIEDLGPIAGPDVDPLELYSYMRYAMARTGNLILKPAVTFG